MRRFIILTLLLSLSLTAACSKAGGGALAGAGVGAAAGALTFKNKALGASLGAGAGLIAGYLVGNEMDKYDAIQMQRIATTQRSGVPVQWVNPDTHRSVQATAGPAQLNADGLLQRNIDLVDPHGKVTKATWVLDPDTGEWYLASR